MQLRRIWDGATLLVQLNAGHSWIDVREILTRLSPRFPEDKLAIWSSNLAEGFRADLAGAARELLPRTTSRLSFGPTRPSLVGTSQIAHGAIGV